MKLKLPHSMIADVEMDKDDPHKRTITVYADEENIFALLDNISKTNILKYLYERERAGKY